MLHLHAAKAIGISAQTRSSLTLLKEPGAMGADIAVGSTQRFGVPVGYGGPHAAYMASKEAYKRAMPGRIVGVSIDSHGGKALSPVFANPRATYPPRESHIKRLHSASAVGGDGVLLCGVSWP